MLPRQEILCSVLGEIIDILIKVLSKIKSISFLFKTKLERNSALKFSLRSSGDT